MTPQRDNKKQGGTARLTRLALLTAIALTIFMAEAQLPTLVPIQGVKLGLANIVTVYAVFALGPGDALLILLSRVFLGAVFSGQMMTLFYSLGGGLLAWLIMCLLRPVFHKEHLWLCSPVAALFHNLGQLLVAAAIMRPVRGHPRPVHRPVYPISYGAAGKAALKNFPQFPPELWKVFSFLFTFFQEAGPPRCGGTG